jgi:SAM-dependent methyltransferase
MTASTLIPRHIPSPRGLVHRLSRGRELSEGLVGVAALGHRDYVGGLWEEIGRHQFDFMVSRGLEPNNVFLDIACGSLRGGVHFIRYLGPGNYLGIDKEKILIRRGLSKELPRNVRKEKRPEFVVSDAFEFDRFSKRPDFSLAQSLFSHLNIADIELCLANLRGHVNPHHELYATFLDEASEQNPTQSHALQRFGFSPDELAAVGHRNGWLCDYLGNWGHPRQQVMMQFVAQ